MLEILGLNVVVFICALIIGWRIGIPSDDEVYKRFFKIGNNEKEGNRRNAFFKEMCSIFNIRFFNYYHYIHGFDWCLLIDHIEKRIKDSLATIETEKNNIIKELKKENEELENRLFRLKEK